MIQQNRAKQFRYSVLRIDPISGKTIELAPYIMFGMEYEERADTITTLTFTLNNAARFQFLRVGDKIRMFGGGATVDNYKALFDGNIKFIRPELDENGIAKYKVECFDTAWGATGREKHYQAFPAKSHRYAWAVAKTTDFKLRLPDIIKNLLKEEGAELGSFDLPAEAMAKEYSLKRPLVQDFMTTWAFIVDLGKRFSFRVWSSISDNGEKIIINIVDTTKVRGTVDKISFVYPLRTDTGQFDWKPDFVRTASGLSSNTGVLDNVLGPNQLILRKASITEDSQTYGAIVQTVTKFDTEKDKDQETTRLVRYDESGVRREYVLNKALVEQTVQSGNEQDKRVVREILSGNDLSWNQISKFWQVTTQADNKFELLDKPYMGVTISGLVDGNVNIRSQRAYMIYGVLGYISKDTSSSYYLRSLRHTWSEDGFETELDFIR